MPDVTLTGRIIVPAPALPAVIAELPTHIRRSREEPGCLEFNVTADDTEPTVFHVFERFESPAAFERHQQRVRTSRWGAITTRAQRLYTTTGLAANASES